jgi:NTE family protein
MRGAKRKQAMGAPGPVDLPSYDVVALVLQGGGALGAYQAGVYEGLHEAGIEPTWLAGISIGALNTAIIAGSPEAQRVDRLREFWETICAVPASLPGMDGFGDLPFAFDLRSAHNTAAAMRALFQGQPGFFKPRFPPPYLSPFAGDAATSFYDTTPLRDTLERLVDFDRLNSGEMRVSVGAVNVRSGNFVYFDTTERRLGPEHFMASGALPPGFPSIEIDGEHYWDGGVVSNTPLSYVLSTEPRRDTLTFQVDLWSAKGELPDDLMEVSSRQKDIQYSSRTRAITTYMMQMQKMRQALQIVMEKLPEDAKKDPAIKAIADLACHRAYNIVHLIYQTKAYEGHSKDFEFGLDAMREHWQSGLDDIRRTLADPRRLDKPSAETGVVTHDVHRLDR